jgi:hypothetical protein
MTILEQIQDAIARVNAAKATTTTSRGGNISVSNTEYKFWATDVNVPRGVDNDFFKYVPYPEAKKKVYVGINSATLSLKTFALFTRLTQINSHISYLKYIGNKISISAGVPDSILEKSTSLLISLTAFVPALTPIYIVGTAYNSFQDAKDTYLLQIKLNNISLDIDNLTAEFERLKTLASDLKDPSNVNKKTPITDPATQTYFDFVSGLVTDSGGTIRTANTQNLSIFAFIVIGSFFFIKKLKNRKKRKK